MKRRSIEQLAKAATKEPIRPKTNRFKTSIYIDKQTFKAFKRAVGRDSSKILEEFMRAYLAKG